MRITRSDGTTFVTAVERESIPVVLPARKKAEALNAYHQAHGADYACAYSESGEIQLTFGTEPGYALGESIRQQLGSKARIIWVEKTAFDEGFIFVILDHGVILDERVLAEDEPLDEMLVMEVFDDRHRTTIHYFGEIPPQLQDYILESGADPDYIEHESALLDQLKPNKAFELREFEDVLSEQTATRSFGTKSKLAIAAVTVFVVAVGLLFIGGEEQVVRVFDKYASYRQTLEKPSATEVLTEIYQVLLSSRNSRSWTFDRCDYEGGPLVCELSPRPGARSIDLNELDMIIGRPVQTRLVEEKAHAIITLQPESRSKEYLIMDRRSAVNALRDRLLFTAIPDAMSVRAKVANDTWSQQNIHIAKESTGFHFVAQIARSTSGLPTSLARLALKRDGITHSIETEITVFGAN